MKFGGATLAFPYSKSYDSLSKTTSLHLHVFKKSGEINVLHDFLDLLIIRRLFCSIWSHVQLIIESFQNTCETSEDVPPKVSPSTQKFKSRISVQKFSSS